MFFFVYNLFSLLLLVPLVLFVIVRSLKNNWPFALPQRFGFIPPVELEKLRGRRVLLLHAVSVGEVIAARPLITALRDRYPAEALVVSTGTDTGRQMAAGIPDVDLCLYFPFDFLPSVRRIMNMLQPSLVIIMETELWPNLCREAGRRGIPLVLANGRISDRSFGRYLKLRWFFRHALQYFSLFCMQAETSRERIIAIGALPERVVVAGNLKYDIPFHRVTANERHELRTHFSIPEDCLVITAGSTHANEEELISAVYRQLLTETESLFLVLAPRHPQRATEAAEILKKEGIHFRRFTDLEPGSRELFRSGEVLLVDTVGELMNLYALSDLAFVGGSLVPTGGHNLLEPASRGIPCLFGPHMSNFREIAALVLECRAGIQVETPAELESAVRRLLVDPLEREELSNNSLAMMRINGGSTGKHLEMIAGQLAGGYVSRQT